MTTFYFNEILPEQTTRDVRAAFEQTVVRVAQLIAKLHFSKPIVTGVASNSILICGCTLNDIIGQCNNRNIRTEAQFLFTHNLIASHESSLGDDVVQELLEAEYQFQGKEAINLAIACKMQWPLLSVPLDSAWEHDTLMLSSDKVDAIEAVNYYAQEDTSYIERWSREKDNADLEGLERFTALFGESNVEITSEFKKDWDAATDLLQELAFEKFKLALSNDMLFPIKTDDILIKKTDTKGSADVYELRQLGQGLRVYFGYSDDKRKIIMAGLHTKAQSINKEQTVDINRAAGVIQKVRLKMPASNK